MAFPSVSTSCFDCLYFLVLFFSILFFKYHCMNLWSQCHKSGMNTQVHSFARFLARKSISLAAIFTITSSQKKPTCWQICSMFPEYPSQWLTCHHLSCTQIKLYLSSGGCRICKRGIPDVCAEKFRQWPRPLLSERPLTYYRKIPKYVSIVARVRP